MVVIYYHGIRSEDIAGFCKQMEYLANSCTVVKPSNIKTSLTNGSKQMVAITFDDGFENMIENAVPVLKMHNLPVGIFVPAGNLGQLPRWSIPSDCSDVRETVMTEDQVVQLHNEGFEIFSHGLSHTMLTELDDKRLQIDLKESKQALEKIIGDEVIGISYPHGAYDTRVCSFAKEANYKLGFTIEPGWVDSSTDNFKIGRISVSPNDNLTRFKLKIMGAYKVVEYLKIFKSV